MRRIAGGAVLALARAAAVAATVACVLSPSRAMEVVRRIELPGTQGRLDHLAVDLEHGTLFVAALGADAVEAVDLKSGQRAAHLEGRSEPQGLAYLASARRLVVANGEGGTVEALAGDRREALAEGLPDADNVRLDATADRLYVGYGHGLAVLDAATLRVLDRIALPGHPEAFELAARGPQIYVNVPSERAVVVIDRHTGRPTVSWSTAPASGNFAMALDDPEHRLFAATRMPPGLQVFDTVAGRRVAQLPLCADADDLFFDSRRHDLYAVCGGGQVALVHQHDPDHYQVVRRIETLPGARTGLFVPALRTLFVAAPARGERPAEVLVLPIE